MMKSLLVAAALLAGACATAPRPAVVSQAATCDEVPIDEIYDPERIRYVAPLYRLHFVARAIQSRALAGAELYVDAAAGVSQAYLERVLSCHIADTASTAHPHDPLRGLAIQDVDVRTQGPYYVITVQGADRAAGRQIWAKAEALMAE
jgi:hypothetical protein